ncbi:hypothetical protein [uncultured Polaribacter sp.]|uniref:hypothetical protein n=1 Tax=uncultured Polaribacter sp. TaxID=174711 RepID=UPI002604A269|nr:hypothetical protein [uncultured Polaribacter sp.]
MTVSKNEIISDYVVVLGSGLSVNDLNPKERVLINSCPTKIGINKYAAFYKKAEISPTHVYFLDDFSHSSVLILKHIINFLKKQSFKEVNFILSKGYIGYFKKTKFSYLLSKVISGINLFFYKTLIFLLRKTLKTLKYDIFISIKNRIQYLLKPKDLIKFNVIPDNFKLEYISVQNWIARGNKWATTIKEDLYHYRGSLTTVLNYISINFPNKKILFVGVDFNSPHYFFQEELNKLNISATDWTSEFINTEKKHFSIIDYKNTKIDDEFPFIIKSLKETGNTIYSVSEKAYLVEKGFIQTIKLNTIN